MVYTDSIAAARRVINTSLGEAWAGPVARARSSLLGALSGTAAPSQRTARSAVQCRRCSATRSRWTTAWSTPPPSPRQASAPTRNTTHLAMSRLDPALSFVARHDQLPCGSARLQALRVELGELPFCVPSADAPGDDPRAAAAVAPLAAPGAPPRPASTPASASPAPTSPAPPPASPPPHPPPPTSAPTSPPPAFRLAFCPASRFRPASRHRPFRPASRPFRPPSRSHSTRPAFLYYLAPQPGGAAPSPGCGSLWLVACWPGVRLPAHCLHRVRSPRDR